MRVIGIDPGLRRTGWGVVETGAARAAGGGAMGNRLAHVASGTCTSGDGGLPERLARLYDALERVFEAQAPDAAAVEQTFVSKDAVATLKLGQARAVALLVPARRGLTVAEYAPNAVKKAVVGVGHADKRQVAHMIARLLPGAEPAGADAVDALAVAVCHAWTAGVAAKRAAAIAAATAAEGRR